MATSFARIVRVINVLLIAIFAASSANNVNRDYNYPCSYDDPYCNSVHDDVKRVNDAFATWLIVLIVFIVLFVVVGIVICACCMIPSCPLHHRKRYRGRVVQNPATVPAGTTVYTNQLPAYPTNQGVIYAQGAPPPQYTAQYYNTTPAGYQQPPNVYQQPPNVNQQPNVHQQSPNVYDQPSNMYEQLPNNNEQSPNIYEQLQNEQPGQTPSKN